MAQCYTHSLVVVFGAGSLVVIEHAFLIWCHKVTPTMSCIHFIWKACNRLRSCWVTSHVSARTEEQTLYQHLEHTHILHSYSHFNFLLHIWYTVVAFFTGVLISLLPLQVFPPLSPGRRNLPQPPVCSHSVWSGLASHHQSLHKSSWSLSFSIDGHPPLCVQAPFNVSTMNYIQYFSRFSN